MAVGGALAFAAIPIPWMVGELFFWWVFVVLFHWPFLVGLSYFHPTRGFVGRLATSHRAGVRALTPVVAWLLALFLTDFWLASLLGPLFVYRPFLLFGVSETGAA
jgi:hypothetical protein